jgi:hypothetical protein
MRLMRFYRRFKHLLPLLLLSSCATISTTPIAYRPGAVVETLSSAVSLSINATDRSMGGNGYMVFRRPDQLHLVILSPFGTTLMEAFALGERIVLVYPSQSTAYSGHFDELPDKGGLQGWKMMRWVMDADPADNKHCAFAPSCLGRTFILIVATLPAAQFPSQIGRAHV